MAPGSDFETIVRDVAVCLRELHASRFSPDRELGRDAALGGWREAAAQSLQRLGEGGEQATRLREILRALEERSAQVGWDVLVPSHGDLGFDALWHDGARLNLYRLDRCCRSHPGLDIGTFLADLLRFLRVRRGREAGRYEPLREVFLAAYAANGAPLSRRDLPLFVAGALLKRLDRLLQRPQPKWGRKVVPLLDHCEAELGLGAGSPATESVGSV